jgi:hypothetical protein
LPPGKLCRPDGFRYADFSASLPISLVPISHLLSPAPQAHLPPLLPSAWFDSASAPSTFVFDGTCSPASCAAPCGATTTSSFICRSSPTRHPSSCWTQDFLALRPRMIKPPSQAPFICRSSPTRHPSSCWTQDFLALRPRMIKPPSQAPFAPLPSGLVPISYILYPISRPSGAPPPPSTLVLRLPFSLQL